MIRVIDDIIDWWMICCDCRVNDQLKVKLCDTALSRDLFPSDYHCLGDNENRPIKWMALETIACKEYSWASDVVSSFSPHIIHCFFSLVMKQTKKSIFVLISAFNVQICPNFVFLCPNLSKFCYFMSKFVQFFVFNVKICQILAYNVQICPNFGFKRLNLSKFWYFTSTFVQILVLNVDIWLNLGLKRPNLS